MKRACPGCRALDGEHNHEPGSCTLATFDPVRWAQSTWVHPTRQQLTRGYVVRKARDDLKRKLQQRVDVDGFHPTQRYHATVLIRGVNRHEEAEALMTAVRILSDAPVGFDDAISYTFHVERGGRPFIGIVASEAPLDSHSCSAHFVARGDEGP